MNIRKFMFLYMSVLLPSKWEYVCITKLNGPDKSLLKSRGGILPCFPKKKKIECNVM